MAAGRQHRVVAIGASAGGVEALTAVVRDLPADFPAAIAVVLHMPTSATSAPARLRIAGRTLVAVVLHMPTSATSVLPAILNRAGALPARAVTDGEELAAGRIYVAPPDHHLVVAPGRVGLSHGPRENGYRPAVDALLRTAALSHGEQAVGVVLSGTLDDGAAGLAVVKERGGTTVVQDPDDAAYRGMPEAALAASAVDHVVPLRGIAPLLVSLVGGDGSGDPGRVAAVALPDPIPAAPLGENGATGLICPDCGGALWELEEGGVSRFRCRVGHAFSQDALVEVQATGVEAALWTALRALEERATLLRRMARRAEGAGNARTAARFLQKAIDVERQAEIVRAGVIPVSVYVGPQDEHVAP